MNMRTCGDPYGGLNPLVDRVLGPKAYDYVRFVAINMPIIQKVAASTYLNLNVVGMMSGTDSLVLYPNGVSQETVRASSVWLKTPDGNMFNGDSGLFTVVHTPLGISITLLGDPPAALQSAEIHWFLTVQGVISA